MGLDALLAMAAGMGVHVTSRRLDGCRCGVYYDAARLVILDTMLPEHVERCVLAHELVHAMHHDAGCGTGPMGAWQEARTRRQTARWLVDPAEYALAERVYGPDAWLIARELDVTVQVIHDWRLLRT